MRSKYHLNPRACLLLVITVTALGCEHDDNVESVSNKEIIWQQTALDSLTVTSLVANSNQFVFAGTCGYGMFRSTNLGETWNRVSQYCIVSLATNSNGHIFTGLGGAIIRSINNGESWILLSVASGLNHLGAFAFNKLNEVFVSSGRSDESKGGIYRSMDNGNTWIQTSFPDSIGPLVLAINSNQDIFAGTGRGVFRSPDDGQAWMQINKGFTDRGVGLVVSALAINSTNNDIFAAIDNDGVYRSSDNGNTWIHTALTNSTIGALVINPQGYIFAASGGYSNIEPAGVFYSMDGGQNWVQINNGLKTKNVLTLAVNSSGYVFAGTDRYGVFRTANSTIY